MRSFYRFTEFAAFVFVFITGFNGQTRAQSGQLNFTNYNSTNGLPDNYIQSIVRDSRGFMWFGTREGLSRFDGGGFKNFFAGNNNVQLKGNSVVYLQEFKPGHLVFISSGQLTCMNTYTGAFYAAPSFDHKTVYWMSKGTSGRYFVSNTDSCYVLNAQLGIEHILRPPLKNKSLNITIHELDSVHLLIGNLQEYLLYDMRVSQYFPFISVSDAATEQERYVFQYYDAVHEWLYFSSFYKGLFRFDLSRKIVYNWKPGAPPDRIPGTNISFIKPKKEGLLWLGSYDGGLMILDTRTNRVQQVVNTLTNPSSLLSNTVLYNYTDNEQNEWLATSSGVSKLNASASVIKSWRKEFDPGNSMSNLLNLVLGQDGNTYVSLYGLPYCAVIRPGTDSITKLDGKQLPNLWCMNPMGEQIVFTGGGSAVTTYDPVRKEYRRTDFLKKYFPESEIVILAFKQQNGDAWYSGNKGGGFVRVSAADGSVHVYKKDGPNGSFANGYYAYHTEDKHGDLWFGVNKSAKLLHWDHEHDRFNEISFDTVPGMTNHFLTGISDLKADDANDIWVAFEGAGILHYEPRLNTARQYLLNDGLPTNYVNAIQFDGNDRLWIGTTKGLSCLLRKQHVFVNFSGDDGLPGDYFFERCTLYDSSRNQLWMGARNTLMRFDPDGLLKLREKKIPVYIDEISVNGKAFTPENFTSIVFSAVQNNLQFRFAAVDINNGRDIEYSYRLVGADAGWIDAGNISTASYANLEAGSYTLMIRAKHKGDNEWSVTDAPLAFRVQAPWFKTWWFRLLVVAAVSLLTWFIIRSYYQRELEKEKQVLEKKQAVEKERTRIATDMHDDFGANLSRIKFISEKLQFINRKDESLKNDLGKISVYSDEMADKMNEIVWALNQRFDSLEDLVSFTRSYAQEYLSEKNIPCKFSHTITQNVRLNGEVRRNIFLVVKECVSNISKHASATSASISFIQKDKLYVEVSDNGKGIDLGNIRPFANGLHNMQARMESIGGTFQVMNENGTTIRLSCPL